MAHDGSKSKCLRAVANTHPPWRMVVKERTLVRTFCCTCTRHTRNASSRRNVHTLDIGANSAEFLHNSFVPAIDVINAID